jgi:hypothetical protein
MSNSNSTTDTALQVHMDNMSSIEPPREDKKIGKLREIFCPITEILVS